MNSILRFKGRPLTIAAVLTMLIIASCNKSFDEPPLGADSDIPVTMTIAELKSRYISRDNYQTIEDDKVISGIVTANDRTGNFFSQIIIQDETGAIPISIDKSGLYATYPEGRRVYVKLKGMMLGDYGGTIQLGLDSTRSSGGFLNVGRIPSVLLGRYIIGGSYNNPVTPKVVKPSELTGALHDPLLSTFVQINNAEFRDADLAKTYADPDNRQSVSAVNFTIKPCDDSKSIVLRNSSYATFAGQPVQQGNGALTGIASVFNNTVQLTIRDTFDVQFKGTRCSGQTPVATTKTIAEVLQYATGDSTIPGGVWVEGVVVSDTKNEAAGNYRIQEGASGLSLYFPSALKYPTGATLGTRLRVYVGGHKFSIFRGTLQVGDADVTATATGTGTVTPRVATIADISANLRPWESTLVTINDVRFEQSGTTSTGVIYTITDATGSLNTQVRTASGITIPTTATSVTGYVTAFQSGSNPVEVQITLRTAADIVGGVIVPPDFGPFTATYNFASTTNSSGATDPTPPPAAPKLTFTNFVATGVGANSSAGGRFSFTGWPTGAINGNDVNFTGSIDLNKYYEVTITPASDAKLDLSNMTFTLQRSSTGVRHVVMRTSADNYASNLSAAINPANANLSIVSPNVIQMLDASTSAENGSIVTFGDAHTNLTTPVTIRFYGYNAETAAGTFSIDNVVISGATKNL